MCSRRKAVIRGAIGVMRPPWRPAPRLRWQYRSSAPVSLPGTSRCGRCPYAPCTSPARRSDERLTRDVSSMPAGTWLRMYDEDREFGMAAFARRRPLRAEPRGGTCSAPYWRNSSVSCRKEHVVVRYGQLAAPIEVAAEHVRHRRVQGDESALPELCPPDQQSSVGLQVIEPQIERLRDAQARCGDEPEERRVHLASEWICPSQSAGGLDDLRHLLGRVDVGQWADLRSGKQG